MSREDLKQIEEKHADGALEDAALEWLNETGEDGAYDDGALGAYDDLQKGGCQSGMVSDLIYTSDCVRFYRKHAKDIDRRLKEICDDCGNTPAQLFARSNWDDDDPLAREDGNLNILAWFGFEEAARAVIEKAAQAAHVEV